MARRNPFRSEAEAFTWLLLTIAAFAAVALASLIGGWKIGLPVWIVVTVAAVWWYLRPVPEEVVPQATPHIGGPNERRILVIANETVAGEELRDAIALAASGWDAHVLIVAPALNTKVRHWTSDDDLARTGARQRLDESLETLSGSGLDVRGEIGDADPLQAIEDALRTFGADEIILSTHPEGRSNWLERGVVGGARERFSVPVTHVVVDTDAG
jgi:hypothetical protein